MVTKTLDQIAREFDEYREKQGTMWLQWEAQRDNILVRVGNAMERIRELEKQQIALTREVNESNPKRQGDVWPQLQSMKKDMRKLFESYDIVMDHEETIENHRRAIGTFHRDIDDLKKGVEALRGKAEEVDDMKKNIRNLGDWVNHLRESAKDHKERLRQVDGEIGKLGEYVAELKEESWGPKDYHPGLTAEWRVDIPQHTLYVVVTEEHGGPITRDCAVRLSYYEMNTDEELITTHPFHISELEDKLGKLLP